MRRLILLISCLLSVTISAQAAVVAVLDYEKTFGAEGIVKTLQESGTHQIKVISEITAENLQDADVLIISHMYNLDDRDVVREFVRQGGGALMTHDAAGSGRPFGGSQSHGPAESTFPEISDTSLPASGRMITGTRVKAIRKHPITEGIGDAVFEHMFEDHAALCPVDDRMVLVEDSESEDDYSHRRFLGTQKRWHAYLGGNAVLMAAPFGQGRVVLNTMLPGLTKDYEELALQGGERTLLLNSVNWLAGATPLGVPETIKVSEPSKYALDFLQQAPPYREKAVVVETKAVAAAGDSGSDRSMVFQLPASVSPGRSVPVVMDVPAGSLPRTVSVVQADGKLSDSVPVQIERRADGKNQLVFIESFPARDAKVVFSSQETSDAAGLQVKLNPERSLAEITGPHFSLLVGCEEDQPTIQSARILDWDWHHTWDGLERNNLSAPILRLAESLWPFKAMSPSIDHEVGLPLPEVTGAASQTLQFPVRVTLQVGSGRLTVYRTGQVHLENFARPGRIATFLVDRYLSDGQEIPEAVSYDLPAVRGRWVWALRDRRYALGGTFHTTEKMGETGLAPGMERQVSLSGDTLVLTTDVEDLERYQVPAVACSVKPRDISSEQLPVRAKSQTPLMYPTVKVLQRRLWKMRGTDEFFDILAQPVEIYGDLLAETPPIAQWQIQGDENVLIGAAMAGPFGSTVKDPLVTAGMKKGDPRGEDADVWRRVYIRCREITDMKTTRLKLTGADATGKTVVVVPVEVAQTLSLPLGAFTYGPQWTSYWSWAGRAKGRCGPDQWPKIMRNIAMSGMDYTIYSIIEEQPEGATEVQSRLERYGFWWMASLQQAYRNRQGREQIEPFYAEHMSRWKGVPNIIAWYLSDEQATGESVNGALPEGYRGVSLYYDLCHEYDGTRPAVNLLTLHSTSYETSTKYLPSDVYSWDPYGIGTDHAYETASIVDTMWRKTKNKPSWITLRVCGPNWLDCLDLWLDIRRRSLASVRGNVDGINYFGYSHWLSDMERHAWYAVIPGVQGPIATPRWQAVEQVVRDIDLLTTAEYHVDRCRGTEKNRLVRQLDQAKLAGEQGRFHHMRTLLKTIVKATGQEN